MFECTHSGVRTVSPGHDLPWSYGQDLVYGEGTCLSEAGPTGCCSGGTLDKPSSGYCLGIVLGWAMVGPYLCWSYGNPNLSILLWSYRVIPNFVRTVPRWKDVKRKQHSCCGSSNIFWRFVHTVFSTLERITTRIINYRNKLTEDK